MVDMNDLQFQVKQARDENALHIHLASMQIREDWDELESQWSDFRARAEIDQTAQGVGAALGQLGGELLAGYQKLRDALKS